jgi:filamentous hemagglutinin family protein
MFLWTRINKACSALNRMKPNMWWLKRSSNPHRYARYLMLFSTLGYVLLPTAPVWANPAGEQVVGGAATFQRSGNTLTVNQSTDRLAVNWQNFNIAAGERTHFNMPSSSSAALNRVLGGNPSSIYGNLSANGTIYLVNPNGILVGPGGTINTGAFIASTFDIHPDQFMQAGKGGAMNMVGSSMAPIVNQGSIKAEKGDVYLIAQKVENRGTISAANGTAALVGAGQADDRTEVVLHEVGGSGFAVRVTQLEGEAASGSNRNLPDGEELLNEGVISAAQAELIASGNIYALAIKNSGTIRAKAVVANTDGTVRLDGGLGSVMNTGTMIAKNAGNEATAAGGKIEVTGQNITASPESIMTAAGGEQGGNGGSVKIDSQDTTIVQGKVDVTAPSAAAKGGKVELLGERVGLLDGAKVDASGGAGGGTVLAGGDYLGGRAPSADLKDLAKQETEPVKNAKATVMADTAEIKADATVNGDGGKIILWSDEYTGFYGDLFARGGVQGGDGGFIETSSKDNLQAFGSANASSVSGSRGMWLLDPTDVTITTSASTGGAFVGGVWTFTTPNPTSSNILNTALNTALAGSAVTIDTTSTASAVGNITVSASVTGAANNLTMRAANNIAVNATVALTGAGSIFLLADYDQSGQGTVSTTAPVTAGTTGSVTLQGSGAIGLGAALTANGGVLITPSLASSSIAINDPTGLTSITTASLQNIVSTGTVTIGNAAGTGTISVGGTGAIDLSGRGYNLALQGSSSTVVFNFTGANTLTLKNGGLLTLNLGTGNLFSPGNTTTDFTVGTTGGMVITSAGQIGSADSSAPFLTSMANLNGTTTGSINISDAGGLTVNGTLSSGNANINLNAGTGGAFANTGGTISAGAGVVTLTANTIAIANTVTGNGGINLVPDAAATTVAINDATGTFSLSAAELAFLESTSVVSIGSATSSGAFNIGSAGSIDLSSETYDLAILKASGATTFNFAAGNTLTLQNNGILSFNVGSGTIQGASLNTPDITIGGNGTISFNSGAVGTTQRLKTSSANYGTSTTSGNVFLTSTRTGGVNFGGTFSVGANNLSLNSAGAVTQDQAITGSGLELLGSGSVTLNNILNNIVNLAGNVTGSGFSYIDRNGFTVGTVNTTGLTTTSGNTTLQALTGPLNVASPLSVSGGNATLQTSAGAITTAAAISSTGGNVTLQSTGGAITTAAAISSTGGTVTLQSTGGDLTVGGLVSAVDQNINLTTSGNLAVNSGVNAAQGTATLTASTIALAANVIGNGGINLIPAAGTAVGIGLTPTSTFGLSTTEMNFLVSTGTVTFGSSGTRVGAIGLAEGGSISLATNSYNLAFYGSGDVTFGGTLTMGNNRGLTLDVGTGTIISAASGVDLAIGGNGTLGITSSGAVGQTANGPLSTQIANLAGATVTGDFLMDNNNVNLLVNGAVNAAANNVTLTTGTGTLSNTSAINSTGTVTLTTDSQDIQARIGGIGATIVLAQQTTGRAIQLGTDGPLYSFTSAELGFLQGTTVRIGATTSSGITITAPILMPNVTNLNLASSGISDSGGTSGISVTGLALTSNGSISLTGSGNSFSTVAAQLSGSSVAGASITINDAVSLAIGTVDGLVGLNNSVAGNGTISLTSGGSITQTAAMTTGTGAITAATTTAGSDILLSSQANNLSSSLFTLGGTQANVRNFGLRNTSAAALAPVLTGATALNDVTLTYNSAPLAIPGIDITGNLSVTSGGAMTQSGNILVDGSTTLTAGANTINLSTFAGNDFSSLSALSATGSTISLKDVNGFLMGTTTATGNLTLNAGAAVTQSGIITAPGLELLGAGSFAFGTLNNAITTLAGNVTGNVSFLDNTGYAIGTVNTVGLTSAVNITLSSSAAVTQSQLLAAVGLELLGTGNYTLTNTGNAVTTLAGNVTGNVNFLDNTGYAIGTVNTVGLTSAVNITLQSTGVVTQSQLLAATGLELLGPGGSFTLTSTGNAITTLAGNTGAVSFLDQTGTTPFTIGTVNTVGLTTTGNTTLSTGTSAGTVTQNQKIQASGLELLGGGEYTLGNALNDVTTLAGNTTGAVSYTDANGFAVGTVNTVGLTTAGAANINLTTATGSTGILTTTAAITAGTTGTVTVTANQVGIGAAITGNGGINMVPDAAATTMGLNDAAGTFNLSAAELQFLKSTGTVKIGSGTSTGTLDIGSLGSINLSGASYNLTLQKTSGATTFNFPATTTLTLADNKTLTFTLGTGTVNGSASNTTDITIGGITGGITLTSGAIGATQRLKTAVSQYNASTISGNASLTELNDLVIAGAFSVGANNLSLSSGGVVTQTAAVTASGLELLGLGSYTLTNTGNAITTLAGNTGAVSFLDETATVPGDAPFTIGTVNTSAGLTTTGNTTLSTGTATGTVTQTQKIQASGLELLGDGAYTLSNTSNDIATLAGNLTTGSLNYTDANGFTVGTVNTTKGITTTSGSVNLTAAAAGNLSVQQAILAGATSTLTAGGEFASVTSPSGLGTVEVTAGTLTITSATINLASNIKANGGIILNPSTAGQTIGLNSVTGGFDLSTSELLNLISSGTVVIGRSVDGTGAYTVGGAGAFDLSAASYDLTLEGLTSAIAFSNGITMGNGRTLILAAGGAITSGLTGTDITIGDGFNSGTLSISSASTVGISGNALSTAIDQLAASTVATTFLSNSRALQTTGAIGVTGNLTLTTGGTLSQSGTGAVTVSGTTAFTVRTGSDVLMADAANNLGLLTLTASGGTTFRDLELRNVNAFASVPTVNAIRNVVFNFDNARVALPTLTLTGTLDVIAGGGPIIQTGILDIKGNSSFASTGFGITLANAGNIFGSNVSLTTTALQNATLVDSTALVLGTSNISALLNLTSGGSITQATGTTLTTGAGITTSFTSAASDLLLTGANAISGQVAFGGTLANIRDVSIQNSSTGAQVPVLEGLTNLQDLTLTYTGVTDFEAPTLKGFASLRNISFSAVGPMTQKAGGISNSGTASFTVTGVGPGNDITLDDALNNFGGPVSLNTSLGNGNATLRESNRLVFGSSDLGTGTLTVDVLAGTTSQTGVITADQMALTAAGDVNLSSDNDIGTFAAALTGSSSIAFNNANALDIGTVLGAFGTLAGITTAAGNITVTTSPGAIGGDINVNQRIFAGGSGSVVLNAQPDSAVLTINKEINTGGAGGLTLQAAGDVTTGGTGVLIGNTTTGAINLVADGDQSGLGTLTIDPTDLVGNILNSSDYSLIGADLDLQGVVRQIGVNAVVKLVTSSVTGTMALGNNTAGGNYAITADELLNVQSAGILQVGDANFVGTVSLGDLSVNGNTFNTFRLQSSPGGLTTVGSAASAGIFSVVSSGIKLDLDTPINLDGNTLNLSSTGGLSSAGADITMRQLVDGGFAAGASLLGSLVVNSGTSGNVLFSSSVGSSQYLGLASASGNNITVNSIDTSGGVITLTTKDGLIENLGTLSSRQRINGALNSPEPSGPVVLTATGTGSIRVNGTINTQGLQGARITVGAGAAAITFTQQGGNAGDVTLSAPDGNLRVYNEIIAFGGDAVVNSLPRGADGTITLNGENVGIAKNQTAYYLTKFNIHADNNLVFAAVPDLTTPENSIGGTTIRMNQLDGGTARLNDPTTFQDLSISYGGAATGTGKLYMGSGSAIVTAGGNFGARRIAPPASSSAGGMTLGEIYTTALGAQSGSVTLGDPDVAANRAPISVSFVDTSGGESDATSTSNQSGLAGGNVALYGTAIRLGQVSTKGSSPLATATVPAIGGTGGAISVTGTGVSILGNLSTDGGTGNGATGVRSNGGSGGQIAIQATGGIVLDSVNLSTPAFIISSSGGDGANNGLAGTAGRINLLGPISAAVDSSVTQATTAATSLDLRYSGLAPAGSGAVVTLGNSSANTISLGTLITAGGTGVTRGTFLVQGALAVDTLTTSAQPYSISLTGKGSVIGNRVTFLNAGALVLGTTDATLTPTLTFTSGFDAASSTTVPSNVQLAGNLVSGPATGATMLMNTVSLGANTTLNSNNNAISIGSIDGTGAGGQNFSLLAGVGGSAVAINGAVGGSVAVGQISVAAGLTQVSFDQSVTAASLNTSAGSAVTLAGDVALSGILSLAGTTTLNSVDAGSPLTVSAASGTISGPLNLSQSGGDGVALSTPGALNVTGAVTGPVNLALAGAGTKTFGTVNVGSSLYSSLVISGGDVSFGALTTAGAIESAANLTFNQSVNLSTLQTSTPTVLSVNVTLGSGMTFSSGAAVVMAGPVSLSGNATLTGAGGYDITGTVTGLGRNLALSGAGNKNFSNTMSLGSISQTGSALTSFAGNVNLSAGADFAGAVALVGSVFTAVSEVNFNTLNLTVGTGGFAGNAAYNIAGAVTGTGSLAMSGFGAKKFGSTANVGGFSQAAGSGTVTFQQNVTTTGVSTLAASTVLDGMTFTANGVGVLGATTMNGVTLSSGLVTLAGAGNYTVNGGVDGAQTLALAGIGAKTFGGIVGGVTSLKGINQAALSGTVTFQQNVTTTGVSTLAASTVLDGMTFTAKGVGVLGATTMNGVTLSSGLVTLAGAGNYTVNGAVGGVQNLTLAGVGAKAFNSNLSLGAFSQTGGQVQLGGNVTTTGLVDLENAATTASLTINSQNASQNYGKLELGGDLITDAGIGAINYAIVNGSGNMSSTAQAIRVSPTTVRNQGTFTATRAGEGDVLVGGTAGPDKFMDAISLGAVHSTKGIVVGTTGKINAANFTAGTSITLRSSGDDVTVLNVVVPGSLGVVTGATKAAHFDGSSTANSFSLDAGTVNELNSSKLNIPSIANITLRKNDQLFSYSTDGNLVVTGQVNVGNGSVVLTPGANFFNNFSGNPFKANSVKIVSQNLFGTWPNNAAVPGLSVVYGVTDVTQLGANQIGIANPLLASPAAPFIVEFTTGTGQPYILAKQAAIPGVALPPVITGEGGFGVSPSYSQEEMEMLTAAERAKFETENRKRSARVILQKAAGQSEVIGAPLEGQVPQAAVPDKADSSKPTAQAIKEAKPLAEKRITPEGSGATRLIKVRPSKVFVLREDQDVQSLLAAERMSAEVNVGSAPVARTK